jgi:hypothetical protein
MAALNYLLGAAGLTAAYLYSSYLTDENNMFEGKPILSFFAWLNVNYFNNMGATPGAYNDTRTFEQQMEARAAYDRSRGDPSK